MKTIKKADILLIIGYIILSFFVTYSLVGSSIASGDIYYVVKIDGEIVEEGRLPVNEEEILPIRTEHGENIIKIDGFDVSVMEADCENQICVQGGPINKPGQIIACLPHHLTVEIVSSDEMDADIISY